jgi:crotonobetainyl-CoA:carnitine CoA-transferase CaiB-like acyl-CoA transferase
MAELGEQEICFGPVNTIDDVFADPQVRHRRMVIDDGPTRTVGCPIKLSDTPASIRSAPPTFGQHTEEVLTRLGFSAEQTAQLRADGVV